MPTSSSLPRAKPALRSLILLALLGMLSMHAWVFLTLGQEVRQGYPDFTAFYSAGKCLRRGLGHQLYDRETQAELQQEFASGVKIRQGPLPFTHPPFEAPLFVPLAFLSYSAAYWTWDAISVLMLVAAVLLLRPHLTQLRLWSGALPFLCAFAFFPVFVSLVQAQDSILLLLLFTLTFVALKDERDFLAGACLGLGLFRFQLALPMLAILLLRRKWKVVAGSALVAVALGAVSVVVVGWEGALHYPQQLLQFSRTLGNSAMNPREMANLRGIVGGLLGTETGIAKVVTGVISAALLALAALAWKADPEQPGFDLGFSLAVVVSVLISYHLMAHDLSLLLIPLLLVTEALREHSIPHAARRLLLPAISLLFFSPLYFFLWFHFARLSALFWVVACFAAGIALAALRNRSAVLAQAAAH